MRSGTKASPNVGFSLMRSGTLVLRPAHGTLLPAARTAGSMAKLSLYQQENAGYKGR